MKLPKALLATCCLVLAFAETEKSNEIDKESTLFGKFKCFTKKVSTTPKNGFKKLLAHEFME